MRVDGWVIGLYGSDSKTSNAAWSIKPSSKPFTNVSSHTRGPTLTSRSPGFAAAKALGPKRWNVAFVNGAVNMT